LRHYSMRMLAKAHTRRQIAWRCVVHRRSDARISARIQVRNRYLNISTKS
jgi:hypothetical protein